jgi:hypothetical protein
MVASFHVRARLAAVSLAIAKNRPSVSPHWGVLVAVAIVLLVAQLPFTHATAWHFFHDAARLLVGNGAPGEGDGLHLFRDHPEMQFGPLSIAVALPFTWLGADGGSWAAMAVTAMAGLAAYWFLLGAVQRLGARPSTAVCTVAGVVFVAAWSDVAVRTAHIDDAIALLATAAALWACAGGQGTMTAVLLGLAAAAKPWAIAFAPIALGVEGTRSRRLGRLALVALIPALTWAPFVLAESGTLDLRDYEITVDPTSTLRAFGSDMDTTPDWGRPAQMIGGFALASIVTLRGRWHAAVLAAVAWRLLLEPGAHRYYTAGAVLGALMIELVARPRSIPWRTIALAGVLELTATPDAPELLARTARLAAVLGALACALAARAPTSETNGSVRSSRRLSRTTSRT